MLGHVQNVGAQFGGHDQEGRRGTTPVAARTAEDSRCKVCRLQMRTWCRQRAEHEEEEEGGGGRQRGREWSFGEVKEKRGEDDGWDAGVLRDSALVIWLVSQSRAKSEKDGAINN